jgi:hypothetical protein
MRRAPEGGRALIAGENVLHTLAEVSIAYTGFSGVVGVFGGGSALSEDERTFRIRIMILASLAAFFGSLLPLGLGQFESAAPRVWFVCCPLLAGYFILNSLSVYRRTNALAARGSYSRPWFAPIIYAINALLILALIAATVALLPGHAVYIVAIVWQLVLASLQFLLLVLQTRPPSAA